jgi:plastocyanin
VTPRRTILRAVAAVALFVPLVAACGSSAPSHAQGASVEIDTFMFGPKKLSVAVGDTVTWTNHDAITHTVTSGTRDYDPHDSGKVVATHKTGTFDKQLDGKGATATATFNQAGTYHYFCDRHPGMEADVDVS